MIRLLSLAIAAMAVLTWTAEVAAEPEVTVTLDAAPTSAQVGETIRLEVRVRVRGGHIQGLELEDLKKYPELEIISHQTMRPMQFSFGFGRGVQMESSLADVYVLRPTAAGSYAFSPAIAKVDGKTYASEPLTVVVRSGGSAAEAPRAPTGGPDASVDEELSGASFDERAFLRTVVEPEDAYVGQQVNVTVYLYTRLRLSPQSLIPGKPSMDGFWVYDDPITSLQAQTASVMGTRFRVYVLQRSAAFPQRSGELTIGPPKVTFDVGGASLFDVPERIQRVGIPMTVKVHPLPQPGPRDAVVGNYSLRASLDRSTARTGDAVTLLVEASGRGNVQDIRLALPSIAGVRTLQPAIRDQQRFENGKLSGTRSWEWILIPEAPGSYVVPPIELQFFDPETKAYGSTQTPQLAFTASGAAKKPEPSVAPADTRPKPNNSDFGPIRVYSALTRGATPVREEPWFAWLVAVPPLLFFFVVLGAGTARRRKQRSSTAESVQRQLLRKARSALHADDPRAFYDGIVALITHALDTRLGQPISGLPHAKLGALLSAEGFDEDLVQRVINELEGADFARFAASGVDKDEMERCLARTSAIIERVHRLRRAD